jgi:hypothetical protein
MVQSSLAARMEKGRKQGHLKGFASIVFAIPEQKEAILGQAYG